MPIRSTKSYYIVGNSVLLLSDNDVANMLDLFLKQNQ